MPKFSWCVAAALTVALAAAPALHAEQEPKANERALAVALEGSAAYQAGRYGEAIKLFQATYGLVPKSALLFNLAQCNRLLGRTSEAAILFRAFLRTGPAGTNALAAARLLVELEEKQQKEAKRGEASQKSELSEEMQLELLVGQPARKLAAAAPPPTAAPAAAPRIATTSAPPPPRAQPPRATLVPALIAAGATVLLAGGGLFEAAQSRSSVSQLQQLHSGSTQTSAAGDADLRSKAQSQASISKVLYVAAGVAAVAGVALYFIF